MLKVALKGLAGRKLRAALTAFAVVLGVAMISGTFVLTDTIKASFSAVFTTVYKQTDIVISGRSALGTNNNNGQNTPPSFPASLLDRVRSVPGVDAAVGGVAEATDAHLVGRNGKDITFGFAPNLGFSVNAGGDQRFNPLTLTAGRFPVGPHEIAIDAHTAAAKHYTVGQKIGSSVRGPVQQFTITGLVKLGGVASLGGATMAIFDLPTAQKLFGKVGEFDEIYAAVKHGVSAPTVIKRIRAILPPTTIVRSGEQQAAKQTQDTSDFTSILQKFLLAFGGIALFVGIFVIANTLSITIAQRAREFGTLRTLGATRKQIRRSVILEGAVIGLLASVTGLFAGLGLAKGLESLLQHFGIGFPQNGTVFAARTVIVSIIVGTLVTVLASLFPALRATRVEPIAAVREGVLPPSRLARFGLPAARGTLGLALALLLYGTLDSGASGGLRLLAVGVGVILSFIGMALVAPRFVPRLAGLLGAPGARLAGTPGSLARQNAMRNPARTASTAAALMIGLALVTAVGVLAAGLKSSFGTSVGKQFLADYALTSENGFSPTGISSERALQHVPIVQVISGVRAGEGRVFGSNTNVTGVSPGIGRVIKIKWAAGGPGVPAALGLNGAFVDDSYAKKHNLHVGTKFGLETPGGKTLDLTLNGIYKPPKGGAPFGTVTISTALFDRTYQNPTNVFAFLDVKGGVTAANTKVLTTALKAFPDAKIQTEKQFVKQQESGINFLLDLLYVLLSLSIIVSVAGIINTLVLTVFERTRELGMLRAVGMSRSQVWVMIEAESVVTALIGATLGIPLGVGLALLISQAIGFFAFAIPWVTLVVFVLAAILAGFVAAILPAFRAARLNVLAALQYE
jgi:putative ABC transport system permease protein